MFGVFFLSHIIVCLLGLIEKRENLHGFMPTDDFWAMAEKQANVRLHICLVTFQPPRVCALHFPKQTLCLCVTSTGLIALLGIYPLNKLLAGTWQLKEILVRSHLPLRLPILAALVYAPPAVEGSYLNCHHRNIFDNLKVMSLSSQGVNTSLTVRVYSTYLLHERAQVITALFQIWSSVAGKDNHVDIAKYNRSVLVHHLQWTKKFMDKI